MECAPSIFGDTSSAVDRLQFNIYGPSDPADQDSKQRVSRASIRIHELLPGGAEEGVSCSLRFTSIPSGVHQTLTIALSVMIAIFQ